MKILIAGTIIVLGGLWYLSRSPAPPPEPEPAEQSLSPSALAKIARIQAERQAKAAMKAKIDPIIVRLESDGITRDDLISYFEDEVVEELDIDGLCSEREMDSARGVE